MSNSPLNDLQLCIIVMFVCRENVTINIIIDQYDVYYVSHVWQLLCYVSLCFDYVKNVHYLCFTMILLCLSSKENSRKYQL